MSERAWLRAIIVDQLIEWAVKAHEQADERVSVTESASKAIIVE